MTRKLVILFSLATLAVAGAAYAGPESDSESRSAGFLGVHLQRIEGGLAEALDMDEDGGVLIRQIVEDSPADEAGLQSGDIVTSVNGADVGTPRDLTRLVRDHSAGDELKIRFVRDGKNKTIEVKLGEQTEREYAHLGEARRHLSRAGRRVRELRFTAEHGYLGVITQPVTGDLAEFFGVDGDGGALVSKVVEDSPAEKLGLRAGDVIVEVDGKDVEDSDDLRSIVRRFDEAATVEVVWVRDRKERKGDVELEIRDTAEQFGFLDGLEGFDIHRFIPELRNLGRHVQITVNGDLDEALDELRAQMDDLREELKALKQDVDAD